MISELITAFAISLFFFVLGVILKGRKDKLGYYLWAPSTAVKYEGTAFRISIKDYDADMEGFSLDGDLQKQDPLIAKLSYTIIFKGKSIFLNGKALYKREGESKELALDVSGQGINSGTQTQGIARVNMRLDKYEDEVVYFLRWSWEDKIVGYWLSRDMEQAAKFSLGGIVLNKVRE